MTMSRNSRRGAANSVRVHADWRYVHYATFDVHQDRSQLASDFDIRFSLPSLTVLDSLTVQTWQTHFEQAYASISALQ